MRGPGGTPSPSRCRPSTNGGGGACSTPSERARSRNQWLAEQSNEPPRPRQSASAKRARSSRSTRCASRRNAPSLTGVVDFRNAFGRMCSATSPSTASTDVVAIQRLHVQAIQDLRRERDAGVFVSRRLHAAFAVDRGLGLAQIVTERAEHHRDGRPAARGPRYAGVPRRRPSTCASTRRLQDAIPDPGGMSPAARTPGTADARPRDPTPDAARSTAVRPRAGAFRARPRSARREDRRVGSSDTRPSCLHPCSDRIGRRTARPAARAGCRRRTSGGPPCEAAGDGDRRWPPNGSINSPLIGSRDMAFTVKSRLRAASVGERAGSPSTANPL